MAAIPGFHVRAQWCPNHVDSEVEDVGTLRQGSRSSAPVAQSS